MKRAERLTKSSEFEKVFSGGRSLGNRSLVLHYLDLGGGMGPARAAFAVSRKIGRAVVRNRIKRLLREAFRHHSDRLRSGRLMVFVARRGAENLGFGEFADAMRDLLQRSGTLLEVSENDS